MEVGWESGNYLWNRLFLYAANIKLTKHCKNAPLIHRKNKRPKKNAVELCVKQNKTNEKKLEINETGEWTYEIVRWTVCTPSNHANDLEHRRTKWMQTSMCLSYLCTLSTHFLCCRSLILSTFISSFRTLTHSSVSLWPSSMAGKKKQLFHDVAF